MNHLTQLLLLNFFLFFLINTCYSQDLNSSSDFISSEKYMELEYNAELFITGGRKGVEPTTKNYKLDEEAIFASHLPTKSISFSIEATDELSFLPFFGNYKGQMEDSTYKGTLKSDSTITITLKYDELNHRFEGQIIKGKRVDRAVKITLEPTE